MTPVAQSLVIATLVLGAGATSVSVMNDDIPDLAVPEAAWEPGSALDGQSFDTVDRIIETGEILTDTLVFRDGTFQSAMCQKYCDFGWSNYQTWSEGDVIHFTATTRCPDAPHTVVWLGQVDQGEISFEASWTTRRWYWTRQITATGEGALSDKATSG